MNVLFYLALVRLPLGTAVTLELLGPLVLSVVMSRRLSGWLWAMVALGGVALLGVGGATGLDPLGACLALGAAGMWVCYILLSAKAGTHFSNFDGLALAMCFAAILTVPLGLFSAGTEVFQPNVLILGALVAVLSSTVPYALEMHALRKLPESTFSILMSLAPVTAVVAGFTILGQSIDMVDTVAIILVICASIGSLRSAVSDSRPLRPKSSRRTNTDSKAAA
ncbi:DMT family transporter [Paenarthrobacter sp. NPDC058040]|uniref:EamA family transporter n=1 Tax=unclassified Paenarthrobacter TaxID=2634190 RepID=UPI0036DF45B6